MAKTCWTCDNFGKCYLEIKTCQDWTSYKGTAFVINISAFASQWARLHRRWYERKYYQGLVSQRVNALDRYLNGRNEADVTDQAIETMKRSAEESLYVETQA